MFRPGLVLYYWFSLEAWWLVLDLLQWLVAGFLTLTKILVYLDLTASRTKSSILNRSSQVPQQIIYSPEDGGEGWSRAPGGCWPGRATPGPMVGVRGGEGGPCRHHRGNNSLSPPLLLYILYVVSTATAAVETASGLFAVISDSS